MVAGPASPLAFAWFVRHSRPSALEACLGRRLGVAHHETDNCPAEPPVLSGTTFILKTCIFGEGGQVRDQSFAFF